MAKRVASVRLKWRCNCNWYWTSQLTRDKSLWCGVAVPRENIIVAYFEDMGLAETKGALLNANYPLNFLESLQIYMCAREHARCDKSWGHRSECGEFWKWCIFIIRKREKRCFVCGCRKSPISMTFIIAFYSTDHSFNWRRGFLCDCYTLLAKVYLHLTAVSV